MKKDILLVHIPNDGYLTEESVKYAKEYFQNKFSKHYEVVVAISSEIKITKIEIVNPTFWNYLKYKFINFLLWLPKK